MSAVDDSEQLYTCTVSFGSAVSCAFVRCLASLTYTINTQIYLLTYLLHQIYCTWRWPKLYAPPSGSFSLRSWRIFMAVLRRRCGHYIFALWFLSIFYLLLFLFLA